MPTKTNLNQPALNSLNWNTPLNSNFGTIDFAFGGQLIVSFSNVDVTLSASDLKNAQLQAIGTLSADVKMIIPTNTAGFWFVSNFTSGSFKFSISINGNNLVIPQQETISFYTQGASIYPVRGYNANPVGSILTMAGPNTPLNYLVCDGSLYPTTGLYSSLYGAIGNYWGGTAGVNFAVPDLRGYFLRGNGTNSDGTVGPALGAKQADSFIAHSHTITDPGHRHGPLAGTYIAGDAGTQFNTWGAGTAGGINGEITTATASTGITATNTGSTPAGGTETRPKNFGVIYVIKYQ